MGNFLLPKFSLCQRHYLVPAYYIRKLGEYAQQQSSEVPNQILLPFHTSEHFIGRASNKN